METRPPAKEIIKGLTTPPTKSALWHRRPDDRTEISKVLGIRYQHVRNVMLRSGIASGLRREIEAEREPVEVDATNATARGNIVDSPHQRRLSAPRRMDQRP
jgi:hypothetical protein